MGDDFNTPILISVLFDAVKLINKVQDGQLAISKTQKDTLQSLINGYVFDVLGLEVEGGAKSEESNETGPLLDLLVNLRSEAKSNQDWSTADAIRNALSELGVTIKDGKEGSTWDHD
jgi:cysteinyl-tRNA synthetase